jgi:endogenous inhibitor of DNA gyrase (YacG/DUF329 family)
MSETAKPKKTPKCPQCGKPRELQYRPFCSSRCRDLDLGKWFKGAYAIPVKDDEYDDQDPQLPPGRLT